MTSKLQYKTNTTKKNKLVSKIDNDRIIVSRHPAAIEFIQNIPEWRYARVVTFVTKNKILGKKVIGNLPYSLAKYAKEITIIEFKGQPPRGKQYTIKDMLLARAYLAKYVVKAKN